MEVSPTALDGDGDRLYAIIRDQTGAHTTVVVDATRPDDEVITEHTLDDGLIVPQSEVLDHLVVTEVDRCASEIETYNLLSDENEL